MQSGTYRMTNEAYHASEGISKTGLDHIHRSPAHYQAYLAEPSKETPALFFGRVVHQAILEPFLFAEQVVTVPGDIAAMDKRTKAYKEAWAEFQEAAKGKTIIEPDMHADIKRMQESVWSNQTAVSILTSDPPCLFEQSVYAVDAQTGELIKCRPDIADHGMRLLADLKTTKDARPEPFSRDAYSFRYHVQAAYYLDICGYDYFTFIAVEKEPPYAVMVYEADYDFIEAGRAAYRRDLDLYHKCRMSGIWPAYQDELHQLSLPRWAIKKEIDE